MLAFIAGRVLVGEQGREIAKPFVRKLRSIGLNKPSLIVD